MKLGLSGKRALVLGASKGLGFGVAKGLADEGAKVVALNNGGDDAINAVKSAQEFGLTKAANVVPLGLDSLPAIKSLGLEAGQGMMYVSPWTPDIV